MKSDEKDKNDPKDNITKKLDYLLNEADSKHNWEESSRRDAYYSVLVRELIKDNKHTKYSKYIFFVIVCIVFLVVTIGSLCIVWIIANREETSYADLGISVSAIVSLLSAIIVLPKIIANHLFPKNSEEVRFDFIRESQKHDLVITDDYLDSTYDENIEDN